MGDEEVGAYLTKTIAREIIVRSEEEWIPIEGQEVSIHDDLFGGFIQHRGTWSSRWSKGECELEITGYGPKPSDIQRKTWGILQPILDNLLMVAIESLPPAAA